MYTALYRRYRPSTFDEMVGQDHIVRILKNQIKSGNTAHAYLFCGTRGTGKTSAARIFAKGVNCLSEGERPCGECENCKSIQQGTFFDVIEIDAASNNRVDNIRELRESVKYPPAAGLCKVYIIDEVHMLSTGAFNALLKTLEEPPEQVIFILATTEPHKLPATILSRCLRLDFRRVAETQIKEKLREICNEQEIEYEESALSLIAANGDGSVRDSLSILEQCIPAGDKTLLRKDVVDILGTAGEEIFIELTNEVICGKTTEAFLIIERMARDGKDIRQFIYDWIFHFRNLMMAKYADHLEDIMNMSCENADRVKTQSEGADIEFITNAITELSATANKTRYSTHPRTLLELAILKLTRPELDDSKAALLQRIAKLEDVINSNNNFSGMIAAKATEIFSNQGDEDLIEDGARTLVSDEIKAAEAQTVHDLTGQAVNEEKPLKEEKSGEKNFAKNPKSVVAEVKQAEDDETEKGSAESNVKEALNAEVIWHKAFTEAEKQRASLRLLSKDVVPIKIDGNSLQLEVGSKLKQDMLEQNKDLFEKYLKEVSERDLKIQTSIADTSHKAEANMEDVQRKLTELFGSDKFTITK